MAEFNIDVLGHEYTIRFIDDPSDEGHVGLCCGISKEIEIRTKILDINNKPKDTGGQQINSVLIHEITHAFDFEAFNRYDFADNGEKCAVLLQKYGRNIIGKADQIFNLWINYRNAENGKDQAN